jgi:hypothetical protein
MRLNWGKVVGGGGEAYFDTSLEGYSGLDIVYHR